MFLPDCCCCHPQMPTKYGTLLQLQGSSSGRSNQSRCFPLPMSDTALERCLKHILIYHTYLSYSLCTLHEMYICMLILRCITTFTSITSSMLPSLTIVTLDSLLPWSNNSLAKNTVVWKERCFYSTKYIYWNIYIWSLCELFTLYIYYFTISNTIIYIHMYVWDDILSGVLIYTYISTLYIS